MIPLVVGRGLMKKLEKLVVDFFPLGRALLRSNPLVCLRLVSNKFSVD